MSGVGTRIKYRTPSGLTVQVHCYAEEASLPVFDAEIIDGAGEVVEYIPKILGSTSLQYMAEKRRWVEEAR